MIRWLLIVLLWPTMAVAQDVWQIERDLAAIGFSPGVIDGVADARTMRAIQEFQFDNNAQASGRLTGQETRYLSQMARFAKARDPFVLESSETQSGTFRLSVGKRVIYANGPDFLSRWRFGTYSSKNVGLGSLYGVLSEANATRSRKLRRLAREMAVQSQNPLSMAVAHLSNRDKSEFEFRDSLLAYKALLAQAEATPHETALLDALTGAMNSRVFNYRLCDEPGGEAFYPLVRRTMEMYIATGLDADKHGVALSFMMRCGPSDQRDAIFQQQLSLASTRSDQAILTVLRQWAEDAAARGRDDIARQQLRHIANHYLPKNTPWSGQGDVFDGFIDVGLVTLMHKLGMAVEARKFGAKRIERIEATNPDDVIERTTADIGTFDYRLRNSAQMFIETRQFDHFYRLGVYERKRVGLESPRAAQWQSAENGPWFLAVPTLEKIWGDDKVAKQYELAKIILPQMLTAGAMGPALQVSLIQAKAAEKLGLFEDAEAAVVRTVSIAQSAGLSASVEGDVQALRRALNLSRLEGLSPAEKLMGQMTLHYGEACISEEAAKRSSWEFPDIDYAAFRDDPSVAAALASSDAMNKLLGCFFPQRLQQYEVRFICAVAGMSGRRDVVDYLIHGQGGTVESYNTKIFTEQCLFGLAHSGRLDWVRPEQLKQTDDYQLNLPWYLNLTPQARLQATAEADPDQVATNSFGEPMGLQYLEKELPLFERNKLAEKFRRSFEGGFGRIGPSDQDRAQVIDNAIGFQQMGFYRAAEIYFANDRRVNPFEFGKETETALNAEISRLDHIALRLRYANLYRDQGDMGRALSAIGPLTELAIARLGGDANPLPGTVEQWAKRFEPLFTTYLELQFEDLPQGPNYPAIFAIQQYLQLANSTASASVLEQRINSASPDLARQYQDARRALRRAIDSDGTRVAELSLQLQAMEARLPESDAALKSHQIGVTRSLRDVVLDLRAADSAMVVATQLPNTLVLMYLDGKGAGARKLDFSREFSTAQVAAFRRGILGSNDKRDLFDVNQAASLYQALIGWGHVGKPAPDAVRLVIDGPFSTLPYAALRRPDGWLGTQASLRLAPSVARAASGLQKGEDFRGFVGLGNPNLTEGDVAGRRALLGGGLYLPELPETANELTFMALSFGGNPNTDVFTRNEASESRMRMLDNENRLSNVSILALATHGLLSRETGSLNSAGLVLSLPTEPDEDGILTATEIYNYRIGADLVVLSACNTGTPGAGAGLSDLASAFLYSGAGALMLTHWEIDSGAGVEIMKRIAIDQRSQSAADYATSLQKALAGMLDDEGLEKYHHPRYWASHFILG